MENYFEHKMTYPDGRVKIAMKNDEQYMNIRHRLERHQVDAVENLVFSKRGFFDIEFDRGGIHHEFRLAEELLGVCGISCLN